MNEAIRDALDQKAGTDYFAFWSALTDTQDNFKDIKIEYLRLFELITQFGYYRYKVNENPIFIQISNNRIIKEVQISDIKTAVLDYVDKLPETVNCPKKNLAFPRAYVKEKLIKSISTYFDKEKLDTIKPPHIEFNLDTHNSKFLYFLNGYLKITASQIQFLNYSTLPGYIWETEQIPRVYRASKSDENGVVKKFFQLVAGGEDRYQSLKEITGYLLHTYFDYKLKAILLTDSTLDQGEANGRTGKTLYGKLVGGILCQNPLKPGKTFVEIGAKNFDVTDKFKYDKASYDTKLIMLNDLKRNFDVDFLYNDITDGIEVNKKNMHPYVINAKLILTSNKTVKLEGSSSLDRFVVFEFTDHFNPDNTPEKEFKQWFFRDWKDAEYNHYYYFMASCVQEFFKSGKLSKPRAINLERRTLIDHTSQEFVDFIEKDLKPAPGEWYDKKTLFAEFVKLYSDFEKLSQRKFTDWLRRYINLSPALENYNPLENDERDREGNRRIRFILKKP